MNETAPVTLLAGLPGLVTQVNNTTFSLTRIHFDIYFFFFKSSYYDYYF